MAFRADVTLCIFVYMCVLVFVMRRRCACWLLLLWATYSLRGVSPGCSCRLASSDLDVTQPCVLLDGATRPRAPCTRSMSQRQQWEGLRPSFSMVPLAINVSEPQDTPNHVADKEHDTPRPPPRSPQIITPRGDLMSRIKEHTGFFDQRLGCVTALAFHPNKLLLAAGASDPVVSIFSHKEGASSSTRSAYPHASASSQHRR